jgi:hypothetical protein
MKKCIGDRVEGYKEGIVRWAYTTMLKNVEELYKTIQTILESIKVKAENSDKLVELEEKIAKIRKEL